ncbi:DUF1120 domain-containing protein [Enterobacter sp. 296B2]|uniref:DUF1120 domain-containing protein n=1 Tax=Enterobacter TaxID=547 RepID=UPI0029310E74|nr:DUF1120 domain-containing protein [Enterobacter sp. 296B2]
MKKLLIATTVAMALSAAAHAADSTALLKVQGVLTNDACTPTLSGGGTVDFGTTYVDTLSSTNTNQLGKKDITLSIACSAPTASVAWGIEDNVGSPAAVGITNPGFTTGGNVYDDQTDVQFGVGSTTGGVKIGAYAVTIDKANSTADGVAQNVITAYSTNFMGWSGFNDGNPRDYVTHDGQVYSLGTSAYIPVAFTNAVFPLRVALAVDKTSTLAITDDTPIAGQATITLYYL